jgi:hypothetical protein
MEALLYPLRALLKLFYTSRDADLYNLNHNGQVCYLRGMLNDVFDPILRRITISDSFRYNYVIFYPEADDKSILFETVLFARSEFIGTESAEFNVNVPAALNITQDEELRMKSLLNYYKLISKRYAIIYS